MVMSNFERLPNGVIQVILSKLSLAKMVAQCSTVCWTWRILCQSVDTLSFESFDLLQNQAENKCKASCIEAIVSSTLFRSSGLRNLKITYHPVIWPWVPGDHFSEETVCAWLDHVDGSLEKLKLVDPNLERAHQNRLIRLSACHRLHSLELCYGKILEIPSQCHSFELLKSCSFDMIAISDSALGSIVELCPMLEVLKLNSCRGLEKPKIKAPSLHRLEFLNEFGNTDFIQSVYADAPKLVNVSLIYVKELITEGEGLSEMELMCHVRPQIQALSSLTSLYMCGHGWMLDSILEFIRLGMNIQLLYIDAKLEEKRPLRVDCFLGHLQDLKSLYIGSDVFECLQAGVKFVSSFQWMSLPHLEDITVVVIQGNEHCVMVLALLLKCATSVRVVNINAQPLETSCHNAIFFTHLLALQRRYPHVVISIISPDCVL